MNNQNPFFNPFIMPNNNINTNYDKLINKIDRLEKNIRILESRLNKLEKIDNKDLVHEEPTDMYMI